MMCGLFYRSWVFRPEATGPSPAAEKALREAVVRGPSTVRDVPADDGGEFISLSFLFLFLFSRGTYSSHLTLNPDSK
jgi:hypothetical protein